MVFRVMSDPGHCSAAVRSWALCPSPGCASFPRLTMDTRGQEAEGEAGSDLPLGKPPGRELSCPEETQGLGMASVGGWPTGARRGLSGSSCAEGTPCDGVLGDTVPRKRS